jgi:hypothetical protein
MTDTFRATAPQRKQDAVAERARMQGFTQGYAAGKEDAAFIVPPALLDALKAVNKTWHKERKTEAMLQLVAKLNEMIAPEKDEDVS